MKRFAHFAAVALVAASTGYLYADDQPAAPRPDVTRGEAPAREDRPAQPRGERADQPRGGDQPREDQSRRERTDPPRGGDQPRLDRGLGRDRGDNTAAAYIATMDPIVSFTEDQKKAVATIFDIRDKAIKEFEADNADKIKAASKAMEDAAQGNDRDAMAKARQEYREMFGPMHEIMRKANSDLEGLLTPDQTTKVAESRVIKAIQAAAAPAQLTDEQLKKLIPIANAPSENRRESVQDKIAAALDQILTPEQKAVIVRQGVVNQVRRSVAGVRLTRDQAAQIDTAYDELAKEAGTDKDELVKKLTEKVNGILTDEQKEAIKNAPQRGAGDTGRRER